MEGSRDTESPPIWLGWVEPTSRTEIPPTGAVLEAMTASENTVDFRHVSPRPYFFRDHASVDVGEASWEHPFGRVGVGGRRA